MSFISQFTYKAWTIFSHTTDEEKPKMKNICWRIGNVPSSWTEAVLGKHLQEIDASRELKLVWLSLFPALTGNTQTAVLRLSEDAPGFFRDLNPYDSHPFKISTGSEVEAEEEVDLNIDCHFHGLTPLNTPKGDDIIDVIAVTGLSGHAFGSWRNRNSSRMWLMDFLPKDIGENLRILTYGYDSDLRTKGKRSMLEFRRKFLQNLMIARGSRVDTSRPIIFIGHSLGCLIITQALLQCVTDNDKDGILESTRAVFFFGAPHGGLEVDSLVEMVENITDGNRQSTRLKLLEQLREDSEFLEDQKERLITVWARPTLRLFSFYELKETPTVVQDSQGNWDRKGEAVQLVKNISSLLFLPSESRYSVDGNHSDMVKFMSQVDVTYQTVVRSLENVLSEHRKASQQRLVGKKQSTY
ncbi:hypothetical protein F5Y13DRAFT_153431 [Hypoxylon sp. FL1857]|nr:hypothetical protein F5Y13DRAFT_153431 [Hypoxylon sp. FL1857]